MTSKFAKTCMRIAIAACMAACWHFPAYAQSATEVGRQAWLDGNCAACHGTRGQGGSSPDYPAGPSLRASKLDRSGLIEVIACGRADTQMGAWAQGAYGAIPCYGQSSGETPEGVIPVEVFTMREVEALTDYIIAQFR